MIGEQAFLNCSGLPKIIIPNSVVNIGADAFQSCSNLVSVAIPNSISNIEDQVFAHCTSLNSVTIPNSITDIGEEAFYDCPSLSSVTIPSSVSSLGGVVFRGCSSLTSVSIPNSVNYLGGGDFNSCASLTNVIVGTGVTNLSNGGEFAFCPNLTSVFCLGNAPMVDINVFYGDTNATVYYLFGTTGWAPTLGGRPTVLWNPQPQTGDGSFGVQNHQFGFNITGNDGLVIVVEAATNLLNSAWIPVATNTLIGGSFYFADPQWANYPGRFYRLRSP